MKISIRWEERIGPILYINIINRTVGFCFCHRRKDRSFHFLGLENFLCARCLGTLTGGMIAVILRFEGFAFPVFWSVLFVIPLILDGLYQALFTKESSNPVRFITGILCGFGLVFIGVFFGQNYRF
jgi:uncharacterized membrane protein